MSESGSHQGRASSQATGPPEAGLPEEAGNSDSQQTDAEADEDEDPVREDERNSGGSSPARSYTSASSSGGGGSSDIPAFASIDMESGKPAAVGSEWVTSRAMQLEMAGEKCIGRLLGSTTVTIFCSSEVRQKLTSRLETKNLCEFQGKPWDVHGEFYTADVNHISVSRLIRTLRKGQATCCAPSHGISILNRMYGLQSPQSSPWKRPLLRTTSSHLYATNGNKVIITYYIYASRLLMEVNADPELKYLMKKLNPIGKVTPASVLTDYPVEFVSATPDLSEPETRQSTSYARGSSGGGCSDAAGGSNSGIALTTAERLARNAAAAKREDDFDFSLEGILKLAESSGYPYAGPQHSALRVKLHEFQRSSLQQMIDMERDSRGLNGYFWEKREMVDGGPPVWYSPLGGEFSVSEPPHVTGGLLCEETGMGKSIEVLATVLSNPRDGGVHGSLQRRSLLWTGSSACQDSQDRIISRATLIIVPSTLLSRWKEEVEKNLERRSLRVVTMEETPLNNIPVSRIKFTGPARQAGNDTVLRSCIAPYFAIGESMEEAKILKGCVRMTKDEAERVEEWEAERQNVSTEAAGNDGLMLARESLDDRAPIIEVEYSVDEWLLADHDVVVTTYETLTAEASMLSKINFHRFIVDEYSSLEAGTNSISEMCQHIKANHRWMVSGTPLTRDIQDLQEALSFLQIWPFSIQGNAFWDERIQKPFERRERSSLAIVKDIVKVIMIRHCKTQHHADGKTLLNLPRRTVEWKGLDYNVEGQPTNPAQHAWYVYMFVERVCVEAYKAMRYLDLEEMARGGLGCMEVALSIMQKIATHAELHPMDKVDGLTRYARAARRVNRLDHTAGLKDTHGSETAMVASDIPAFYPEEILRGLLAQRKNEQGGLSRDDERRMRASLEEMTISELKTRIEAKGLPMPRSWVILRETGTILSGTRKLSLHCHPDAVKMTGAEVKDGPEVENEESWKGEGTGKGKRRVGNGGKIVKAEPRKFLRKSDTLRVERNDQGNGSQIEVGDDAENSKDKKRRMNNDEKVDSSESRKLLRVSETVRVGRNVQSNEAQIKSMHGCNVTLVDAWRRSPVTRRPIYVSVSSAHKKPYIDILVAKSRTESGIGAREDGFGEIYKAMAGHRIKCPVCWCEVERPTVTSCAHLFCWNCTTSVLGRSAKARKKGKCPMCRKYLNRCTMVCEMQLRNEVEDIGMHDNAATSGTGASSSAGGDESREASMTVGSGGYDEWRQSGLEIDLNANQGQGSSSETVTDTKNSPGGGGCAPSSKERSPHLVIPEFQFKAIASEEELRKIPNPAIKVQSNREQITLRSRLLSQHEAAIRSNSSVKFDAMICDMDITLIRDSSSKFVVFSRHSEVVKKVKLVLRNRGLKFTDIQDTDTETKRIAAISSFKNDESVKVIVMTTGPEVVGMNLTAASTIYMLEPAWSPEEEAYVLNRAYQIGQESPVRCVIYYMRDTMDERILALRAKKGNFGALLADDSEASERWGRTDPLAKRQSVDWFKHLFEGENTSANASMGESRSPESDEPEE